MRDESPPVVVVIGGPNGAGKTTAAGRLLPDGLDIRRFVNADAIAKGLSGFDPEAVAFAAGRLMLQRIRELAAARESFAFESTLASRSFAPLLRDLSESGYEVLIYYVWLRSPELAIERVKERVRRDGHSVPPEVISHESRSDMRERQCARRCASTSFSGTRWRSGGTAR
jgi:predicted ABC-type ATPase